LKVSEKCELLSFSFFFFRKWISFSLRIVFNYF
jgi:hypothetical protein